MRRCLIRSSGKDGKDKIWLETEKIKTLEVIKSGKPGPIRVELAS